MQPFTLGICTDSLSIRTFLVEQFQEKYPLLCFETSASAHEALLRNTIMAFLDCSTHAATLHTWESTVPIAHPLPVQSLEALLQPWREDTYAFFSGNCLYKTFLKNKRGEVVSLRQKEAELLHCLLTSENHAATREHLLETVWHYGETIDTHTLETHIYQLRQKLEDNPNEPHILVHDTQGYALLCT